jgi:hypothetical protein
MPRLAVGVMIIISLDRNFPKESFNIHPTPSHPDQTDPSLVIGIDPINPALKQLSKHWGSGAEQSGPELSFQLEQRLLFFESRRNYSLDLGLEFGLQCLL